MLLPSGKRFLPFFNQEDLFSASGPRMIVEERMKPGIQVAPMVASRYDADHVSLVSAPKLRLSRYVAGQRGIKHRHDDE